MKLKTVVAVALIIFIVIVGNIIAIGLYQKYNASNLPDSSTNIYTVKKNQTSSGAVGVTATSTTSTTADATGAGNQNAPVDVVPVAPVVSTPAPVAPPMRMRTRAS